MGSYRSEQEEGSWPGAGACPQQHRGGGGGGGGQRGGVHSGAAGEGGRRGARLQVLLQRDGGG